MSKRTLLLLAALMLACGSVVAQPMFGGVAGTVFFANGDPAVGAAVILTGVNHDGHHPMFRTFAGPQGHFGFPRVPAGAYNVTAMMRMRGFDSELIEVVGGQTTNVILTLQRPDSGHHPDSLTMVDLQGTAILLPHPDHPDVMHYFLDVDGDTQPDYRLAFGPPWYNSPDTSAHRPANGDMITVRGGLLAYSTPPTVVVTQINGHFWRDLRQGHGGHGGGDHWRRGCNPDSLMRVEMEGTAIVTNHEGWHGEMQRFAINTDADPEPEYALDFGGPNYDPENGATRPANGDNITIVGGQIYCPNAPLPIVIVYEINGMFWREPGDTLGLGAIPMDVGDPIEIGAPTTYLTAQNYPNPFNPTTTINYSLPVAGEVKVSVFDITGREVATLFNGFQNAGSYAVAWDGRGQPSGIYFYRVSVGRLSHTGRMVLMK